jgi:hypothetical protein
VRSSQTFLAIVALVSLSCGNGVDDLSLESAPLGYVRGKVDLGAIDAKSTGKPLRAALVWGAVPNYVLACVKYPLNAEIAPACPNPFGFVPGLVEAEVEVGVDGSFTLPLRRLPDVSLSVGDDSARIAWGSVVVAADSDGNGSFNLLTREGDDHETPKLADLALAASFFRLDEPQQRVAFREGGWDEESLFYPPKGCAAPPVGFSALTTPGLKPLSLDPAPGECTSASLDATTIEPVPLSLNEAKGLACRSINRAQVRQPGLVPPGEEENEQGDHHGLVGKQVCLDAETLAIVGEGDCPTITVMPLSGCRQNLVCQKPDWDFTKQPPPWWPCAP